MSGSTRETVTGKPISLLKLRAFATVGPCAARTVSRTSLVDVFPAEPVIPTTVPGYRAATSRAIRAMASRTSSTTTAGASTGRVASTATAPPSATARSA